MRQVACFCGISFQTAKTVATCPRCGQVVLVTPQFNQPVADQMIRDLEKMLEEQD